MPGAPKLGAGRCSTGATTARRAAATALPGGATVLVSLLLLAVTPATARPLPERLGVAPAPKHEEPDPGPRPGEPPAQGFTACVDGRAGAYPCAGIDLLSFVPISAMGGVAGQTTGNDVWGWTDTETGREYALMGLSHGTAFVDVSDPRHPAWLGLLRGTTFASTWRSIKVYRDHALVVADRAGAHGLQVFDLRRLRDLTADAPQFFDADVVYAGFGSAHNVALDEETGFAFAVGSDTCAGGLHIVDVREPLQPRAAGCFAEDGYTHDVQCVVYRGPDARYGGRELCFASNEDTLTIVDVSDKAAPRMIARASYAGVGYTHQGWLSEDHRHFLLDDELDEIDFGHPSRTYLWDVSDVERPFVAATHTATSAAIDHNQYVHRGRVYQANYRSGVRVYDLARLDRGRLGELGFFDIVPADDAPSFNGAWNVYPFFPSGTFVASGIEQGLYILGLAADRVAVPAVCSPSDTTLCLADGRFALTVDWSNRFDGRRGRGRVLAGASELAGSFAFDDPQNPELLVKLLDFGEHTVAFWGQLTNLPFALRVIDTATGNVRTYRNGRNQCGGLDLHAFADPGHQHAAGALGDEPSAVLAGLAAVTPGPGLPAGHRVAARPRRRGSPSRPAATGSCAADAATLCLLDGRYAARLSWANQYAGTSGNGTAAAFSRFAGTFGFDDPRNLEVMIKTLDFGDRILVLWGSLSDLGYTLNVRETASGRERSYANPPGRYCGGLDDDAF